MTIPQFITAAGWVIFGLSLAFYFEFDESFGLFLAPEMRGLIGFSGMIVGLLIAVGGLCGEHFQEKRINRLPNDDRRVD